MIRIGQLVIATLVAATLSATGIGGAAELEFRVQEISNRLSIGYATRLVDMNEDGKTDITFTCSRESGPAAVEKLTSLQEHVGFTTVLYDDHIGKVSLVGAGMRSHPGVTATFCEALASVGVNIDLISTSEIRISVLVKDTELDKAVVALHEAFGLGGDEEAVVYAGTGR